VAPGFCAGGAEVENNPDSIRYGGGSNNDHHQGESRRALPVAQRGDDFGPLFARWMIPSVLPAGQGDSPEVFDQLGGLTGRLPRPAGDMVFSVRASWGE